MGLSDFAKYALSEAGFQLPVYPWDSLNHYRELASAHPLGIIDLSIGSPADPTPLSVQQALRENSDWPAYPRTIGTEELQSAMLSWARARNIYLPGAQAIIPTVGSKEAVALIPWQLGIKPGDTILIPECSYPTYEVSALLAGAKAVFVSPDPRTWPKAEFAWINYPANPDGRVANLAQLQKIIEWGRENGCVIASDECYAPLDWRVEHESGAPSLLDERITGKNNRGLLMLYSLSKQSNFAGYRGALVAGDENLISRLAQIRKHTGLILPGPIQAAMAKALTDIEQIRAQRKTYALRRASLLEATKAAGLVNHPENAGGLYLWLSHPSYTDCWVLTQKLAELGILVAPGTFYGKTPECKSHIRLALTAGDNQVEDACRRLFSSNF
ncbi:succinyldiaminopimelate transaminase [Actinomycetaceae bacterium TAE3-ERU4]|nr:succinyldiaminopimelate transaminase [Actinomycetaceae bacterium TAE3-ERU4]